MLRTLPLLLAGLMASSAAFAQTPREPTQIRVSLQGVNFQNPADVARLYHRLHTAADQACDSNISSLGARAQDRACAAQALDGAVQTIHQPSLLAMHSGGRTMTVASNQP
jgi:UrcA family protein